MKIVIIFKIFLKDIVCSTQEFRAQYAENVRLKNCSKNQKTEQIKNCRDLIVKPIII